MRKKLKYLFFVLPFLVVFNSSCVKNETCISGNNKLKIGLYKYETDSTYSEITLDSLSLYFVGNENSLVYDRSTGVSTIDIPLSDTTRFLSVIMKLNDGIDIMDIFYEPFFVFRSTECGVINRYRIDSIHCTGNKVEYLEYLNKEVNESEAVNLLMAVDID